MSLGFVRVYELETFLSSFVLGFNIKEVTRHVKKKPCLNDNRDKNPLKPLDKDRRDTQRLLWVSKSNNPQGPKADSRETYK